MRAVTRDLRAVLAAFAVLAFFAGVLLFARAGQTDDWFSWTIQPPLTAAFLGASYWAALVLLAWSARQRLWSPVRATIPPVATIAVLLLAATLIHLDKFDLDSLFGWFWLFAYFLVPPTLVIVAERQRRMPGGEAPRGKRIPAPLLALLAIQGTVMLALGIALFAAPAEADAVWPWALTPLTARAVGAFLVGFGIAAWHAVIDADLSRFEGAALAYAALGALQLLALAFYGEDLDGGSLDSWIYAGFCASVLAAGAAGTALAQRARRRAASAGT